ncbi:MAG: hypothetical protein RL693_1387 [Verrucomicrobiota bacterium]
MATNVSPFMKFVLPAIAACAFLLSSCASTQTAGSDYLTGLGGPVPTAPATLGVAEQVSYWDDDGSSGNSYIVVDLKRQVAQFYRGGHVIGVAAISSGTEIRATPAGNYKILEKHKDHFSSKYGSIEDASGNVVNNDATPKTPVPPGCHYAPAPMTYFMRLTNDGVGMHQGYLPGYPASHGCIRMDRNIVPKFFENATVGMPVQVIR